MKIYLVDRCGWAGRVLSVVAGVLLLAGASRADKLTLDDSVRIALEHNPAVAMAAEDVRKTSADIDLSSSEGMPKLNLNSGYTRLDKASSAKINGQDVIMSVLNSRASDVTLTQPLDVFGIIKMGRHMASLGKVQAVYELDRVKNDTELSVKEAFFNVLRAQDAQKVVEERVAQLDAHRSDAELNYKAGNVSKFDVMRAETELANAKVDLVTAQNGLRLAKSALNNSLGRDLNTPFELVDPGMPQLADIKVEDCIEAATKSRPEVKSIDTQVELSDKLITIAKRGRNPKVNLTWKINRNFTPTFIDSRASSWLATLFSFMPILDGGRTSADVAIARSDAENAKSGQRTTLLGVALDAKNAYLALQEARESIGTADKGLSLAREGVRLAQVSYRNGLVTQTDVLDAETSLVTAENYYVNATYNYHVAFAKLEQAVGGKVQMARLIVQNAE